MDRKLQRIILDLEDLIDDPYLNIDAKEELVDLVRELGRVNVHSTEL